MSRGLFGQIVLLMVIAAFAGQFVKRVRDTYRAKRKK